MSSVGKGGVLNVFLTVQGSSCPPDRNAWSHREMYELLKRATLVKTAGTISPSPLGYISKESKRRNQQRKNTEAER